MRKFCFLAVAVAMLALLSADSAQAGGRRTRYYSYGGTTVTQRATSQGGQPSTIRRYSYGPAANSGVRYSYAPAYGTNRPLVMGATPYGTNYWRADRKILGY